MPRVFNRKFAEYIENAMRFRSFPEEFPKDYRKLLPFMAWADQQILERYYGLGMEKQDPQQIAKEFCTSVDTVRKRLKISLARLERLPKK